MNDRRINDHRSGAVPGFTGNYKVHSLMAFEQHRSMKDAILREKCLRKQTRAWKIALIEELNPYWDELAIGLSLERLPDRCSAKGKSLSYRPMSVYKTCGSFSSQACLTRPSKIMRHPRNTIAESA